MHYPYVQYTHHRATPQGESSGARSDFRPRSLSGETAHSKKVASSRLGLAAAGTLAAAAALSLVSCGDGESDRHTDSAPPRVLASLENLAFTEANEDAFPAHRPEVIDCNNVGGYYLEDGFLEVDTGRCNYLSLSEPALLDLEPGAILETEISYFDLTAPEPAEAHLGLAIGGHIVWEETIPIPSDGQVLELSIRLEHPVTQGDSVELHLHNHGQNTWNFSPLLVR